MKLVGAGGQQRVDFEYDASGTIGTTAAVVLARSQSRSSLFIQNLAATALYVEIDGPRATATISGGAVTGFTITNAGFNYTKAPVVRLLGGGNDLGGGNAVNRSYLGLNQPNGSSPSRPCRAHAVLTGGAVSSIVIDDPGANYAIAPYVLLFNDDLDPYGCAIPTAAASRVLLTQGASFTWNGTVTPTGPVALLGAAAAQGYIVKWTD